MTVKNPDTGHHSIICAIPLKSMTYVGIDIDIIWRPAYVKSINVNEIKHLATLPPCLLTFAGERASASTLGGENGAKNGCTVAQKGSTATLGAIVRSTSRPDGPPAA